MMCTSGISLFSPISSMHLAQMIIAQGVVIKNFHLVGLTFETHAFVASGAGYPVTPVCSDHWDLAFLVGTLPDSILHHVFLEQLVTSSFGFLACHPRMVFALHQHIFTLHSIQRLLKQTSH